MLDRILVRYLDSFMLWSYTIARIDYVGIGGMY